jgi:hydrogenase-1 operon protein HyaE
MTSALIEMLNTRHGMPLVDVDGVDVFAAGCESAVLLFTGDPTKVRESDDVAVILPELIRTFPEMEAAVVSREAERPLQARYRFTAFPALVFLRRGGYLGAISRVREWPEYLRLVAEILAAEPGDPPPFNLDEVCAA